MLPVFLHALRGDTRPGYISGGGGAVAKKSKIKMTSHLAGRGRGVGPRDNNNDHPGILPPVRQQQVKQTHAGTTTGGSSHLFLKVPVQVQWAGFTEVSPSLALKAAKNS